MNLTAVCLAGSRNNCPFRQCAPPPQPQQSIKHRGGLFSAGGSSLLRSVCGHDTVHVCVCLCNEYSLPFLAGSPRSPLFLSLSIPHLASSTQSHDTPYRPLPPWSRGSFWLDWTGLLRTNDRCGWHLHDRDRPSHLGTWHGHEHDAHRHPLPYQPYWRRLHCIGRDRRTPSQAK
ncbi:hypothetical protein BCR34DRAFT_87575 [Clohesyomyces aquaticus]|uniref:Uncharacterized protein n=1 Tax=Clohesyomyces aquaticus TaxID=1231657 RepID=A0A1Y2A335_9PLEO|nr:hypothetical protein BCR34DRAFT_87575 [Clohesyomyces aquaticus]